MMTVPIQSTSPHRRLPRRHVILTSRVAIVLAICCVLSLCLNFVYVFHVADGDRNGLGNTVAIQPLKAALAPSTKVQQVSPPPQHSLSCLEHGGPSRPVEEMVYWRNIPSDANYVSPFFHDNHTKYLLFEVDAAGFNNKRISLEDFIVLAHATGRTLVLPPKQTWWANTNGEIHGFEDVFDLESVSKKNRGIQIITMEEFLKTHAIPGQMRHFESGEVVFPPNNQTDWNHPFPRPLKLWLQNVTYMIKWRPEDCISTFPSENTPEGMARMVKMKNQIVEEGFPSVFTYLGHPTPVNAPPIMRMREMITERKEVCLYNMEMQDQTVLYYHIVIDGSNLRSRIYENIRLLIWFYSFFFFEDWKQDLWVKRFMRDNIRYRDIFHCAADRMVDTLRDRARQRNASNTKGEFDTFHIRRQRDFADQFGNLTTATEIYEIAKADLVEGGTIYIATDESDHKFFDPLVQHYDVMFLDDFLHLITDIDPNYYGLIDQLVASQGRKFFGAWCSSFTGYINRIRGYQATKWKLDGYKEGHLESYIYNMGYDKRNKVLSYHPPVRYWYFREFPIAWRDIDFDIEAELPA